MVIRRLNLYSRGESAVSGGRAPLLSLRGFARGKDALRTRTVRTLPWLKRTVSKFTIRFAMIFVGHSANYLALIMSAPANHSWATPSFH